MLTLILRRLVALPILIFLASLLVFLLPHLTGIDPARAIIRARIGERDISPEAVERFSEALGLNRPLAWQYANWLGQLARGDLGYSYVSRAPVAEIVLRGLKVTLVLSGCAVGLAIAVAIPLGLIAARRPGHWLDNLVTTLTQAGVAIPEYWLGPMLVLIFALGLGWLPSAGWRGPLFIILPVLTMTLRPVAYFTRITRTAVIEVYTADYIRTARAKGLSELQIASRHALRNGLIPVVTLVTIWLASLLGGSVIVEVIFAIPGLGRILYEAALAGDIPLLQAGLVLLISLVVIINSGTDMLYVVLNPAIRLDNHQ